MTIGDNAGYKPIFVGSAVQPPKGAKTRLQCLLWLLEVINRTVIVHAGNPPSPLSHFNAATDSAGFTFNASKPLRPETNPFH